MKSVRLEDVATFVRGITFKPTDLSEVGVGVMRTKNVQEELDLLDILRVPARLVKREEQYLRFGDTLISSANSWNVVGKACWIPKLPEPLAIGGFVTALRPAAAIIEPRYLYRWFSAPRTQAIVRSFSNKTTSISNLNLKLAAGMPVPLPSLDEQRRIAAILDHADVLRTKRRQVLAHLDSLRRSLFLEMFGLEGRGAVTARRREKHPRGWEWVLLTDVSRLATGHTPDRTQPEYWGGDISWISLPEIRGLDGFMAYETQLKVTQEGIDRSSAVVLPVGAVCFSRTASIGFVTTLGVPMATSQDFHNWIPGTELSSVYLMEALRASRSHLLGASDGSIHKTIYQRTARDFRVLLPPIELQRAFADRVRAIQNRVQVAAASAARFDELFASLQSRAFKGEL